MYLIEKVIDMKVIIENGIIKVKSEYNRDFIKKAKMIQGKWDSPYWTFPEENQKEVRELLLDIYGYCAELADEPVSTVTVEVNLDEFNGYDGDSIKLDTMTIARRISRDRDVILHDNVMCLSGGFKDSGGSAKNPRPAPISGTVLRVKDLPVGIYERIKDKDGIRVVSSIDKKALIDERERLISRIRTIDELLKDSEE